MSDARLRADALELQASLSTLIRYYQFRDRDRICCHDISVTQCYALETLVEDGPQTVNGLAAALYLDKSTTSRVADALERKNYLRRGSHPEDGRAVVLAATAAGARLYRMIAADMLEQQMELLRDFEPPVRQAMARLLDRLAVAAAARVDASGGTCCATG